MASSAQCPVCPHLAAFKYSRPPARYHVCKECGTIFQQPMPSVGDLVAYANREYASGVYREYVEARAIKFATFRGRLGNLARRLPGRRMLDVGCSCGYCIDVALELGFDAYGIEFSPVAIAAASAAARPRITEGDLADLDEGLCTGFDVVTAFDVLEHTLDPLAFLERVRRLLSPGGLLVVTTPDTGHILRQIMGARWPMLQPHQHTVLFSRRSLRLALQRTGYTEIELGPAAKVLTPDYLAKQVRVHTPAIAKLYEIGARILPRAVRTMAISVNIGETFALARAPGPAR